MLRGAGELVGDCRWPASDRASPGRDRLHLRPAHAGNGYATEASRELLRLGFEELGLHRIIGRLDARNAPRARARAARDAPEARMLENEFVKGEWTDELVYALLEHEWRS